MFYMMGRVIKELENFSSTYLLIRIERDNQLHTKIFCTYTEPLTIVSIM